MKVGNITRYKGEYTNCHKVPYKITKVWRNAFGLIKWVDLECVNESDAGIYGAYKILYSVPVHELITEG